MARYITREKITVNGKLIKNVTFYGRTLKRQRFVLRNTENLFGTDWMEKFVGYAN